MSARCGTPARRWPALLLATALTSWFASAARADSASGVAAAAARAHYRRGEELFRQGRMEEAITAFSAGYEAEPKPQFLLNLAQCYRAIGQRKHAIRYLHRFIAAAPAHALRPAAERTLRRLEQVEREASPKPASASRPAVPGPVLPGASKPAAPVGPRAASRTKWVWIIGLAAAAVAGAIGVGVYFGTRPAQPELGTLRLPP